MFVLPPVDPAMVRNPAKKFVVLFCSLMGLLAAAYFFRGELLRAGANGFLASSNIAVLDLQALQVRGDGITADGVDVLFETSGLRLTLAGIDVRWRRNGVFSVPVVDSVSITSATVRQTAAVEATDAGVAALQLGDLLQLLREFPLAAVAVAEITVPGWPDAIAFGLQRRPGELSLQVVSANLQLRGEFTQADATAAAQLQVELNHDAKPVGNILLDIEPVTAGWQLHGNAHLDLTSVAGLPPLTRPDAVRLPFTGGLLDVDVAAVIADDLLDASPEQLDVAINDASFVTIPAGLIPDLGPVAFALTGRAETRITFGEDLLIRSAVLPLTAAGEYQAQPFTLAATIRPADCRLSGNIACTAGFEGDATLAALTLPGDAADPDAATDIDIRDLAIAGGGLLELDAGNLQLSLNAGTQVSTESVAAASFNIAGLSLENAAALVLQKEQGNDAMTINGTHLSGTLRQLDTAGYRFASDFQLRDIDVTLAAVPLGQFTLQTLGFTASGPQPWLPAVDIDAQIKLDEENLTFTTPVLLRDAPSNPGLRINGSYALATGSAALAVELPRLSLDGEGKSLSSFLSGWPWPFDLMTGDIEAGIELQLQSADISANSTAADAESGRVTASINGKLTNVAGYYNEMFFRGVNTTLVATADTSDALPLTTLPLAIAIDEINVGLPVSNIAVDYQVDGADGSLTIHSLYGETLGGTLTGDNVVYDVGSERNTMTLHFDGLRLDRLLELVEYDGIDASGAISGELPISITSDGVEVAEGRLQADAPGGSIRYQSAAGAGGNPGIDLVNQALSNYQFESLESSIDYRPDGELLLSMQLQGHNPDMNDGQRINLNLNLSDNIPVLLQSLQAGRAIEEFVQDQYQRDQE